MSAMIDTALQHQIDALQAESAAQEAATVAYFIERARRRDLSWDGLDSNAHHFLADKMVALEPSKAEFCHMICLALRAKRVVEVGTSFGISTLYLADAIRTNGGGIVIGTEHEPTKAAKARDNFTVADLAQFIDLREGDLRETLKVIEGPIDFVLMDIWPEMALPALKLVAPHLRKGAVVVADNTVQFRAAYQGLLDFVSSPDNGLRRITLPFEGGLDMIVKV